MTIVIIGTDFLINNSGASSNLIRNLSKGLSENGASVHVINLSMEYGSFRWKANGIHYYIPLEQKIRDSRFLLRLFHRLNRFVNIFQYIRMINYNSEKMILLTYSESIWVFLISKSLRLKYFQSSYIYAVEHPFRNCKSEFLIRIKSGLYQYLVFVLFDGLIAISTNLSKSYKSFNLSKKLKFILPPVTDPGIFESSKTDIKGFEYIAFCGTISIKKDRIDLIIKSFFEVLKSFPEMKLLLIGKTDDPKEALEILEMLKSNDLEKAVILTGHVNNEKVAGYITNARLLVLARGSNLQNDNGFPSKLPEYLATKNPVIVTDVSDISLYLKHNVNCYIVEPDNLKDLTEKMLFSLNNPEISRKIAEKGYLLTLDTFNYLYQTRNLLVAFNDELKQRS